MLVGPRLEHKGGGRLELRHMKIRPTVICAFIALIAALTADSKHHRDVLRCATHERHNKREDNDCVVTSSPRGVDRLWEKRLRSTFEVASADIVLEVSNALRTRQQAQRATTANATRLRLLAEALHADLDKDHPVRSRQALKKRPGHVSSTLVVTDEAGMRRKVHVFDDIERASHALKQIQTYLDEASIGPAALSLKYDDSGTDELLVCLCLIILIYALCQPAYEVVTIDAHAEVVRVRRRNLLGYACLDLAVAVENVDQLTVTEHALVHDLLTYENRAEILRDATRVEPQPASRLAADAALRRLARLTPSTTEYGLRLALHAPPEDNRRFVRRCVDVDLAFGCKFGDSAALKKAVEEANAALLKCGPPDIENETGSATDCAVCLVRRRDAVLAPCGHMCACYRCASRLERRGERCPICRAPIASVVKVFA